MARIINVYTISAFVALGSTLWGLDASSMVVIIGTHQYKDYYGNPLEIRQGEIISAIYAGSIVGALLSSVLGDQLSRKVAIQVGAGIWCVGAIVQCTSIGVAMLIVGRVISGLCIGLTSSLVPIYQCEIAPPKIRGRVVSFHYMAITFGILVQYFVQYGCSFIDSPAAFRVPWATQAVPAIILLIGLFWFPYSPRWLASKNRWDEALLVLAFLRTANCNINNPLVLAEYKEIEGQLRLEGNEESDWLHELLSRKMRKRVFLVIIIHVCQFLSGIPLIVIYGVYVFQSAGINNPVLALSILYIIAALMSIPSVVWIDQWGRRPSLLVGAILFGFLQFLIGGLFRQYGEPNPVPNQPFTWIINDHPAVTRTIQAGCYLFVGIYSLTWGPVTFIYPTEIIPLRIRSKTVSLTFALYWIIVFLLNLFFPVLFRSNSWRLFFIFGSLNIAAFIYVLFAVPETKQRTLEEMDEIFEYDEPLWKSFLNSGDVDRLDRLARDIERGNLKIHQLAHLERTTQYSS
ncbi:general substrate transporter [Lipomyces starkeyi]